MTKSSLRRKCSISAYSLESDMKGSRSRNLRRRSLEAANEAEAMEELLQTGLLCYSLQPACLLVTLHTVSWPLSHSSAIEKMATAHCGWRLSVDILSAQMALASVKLTKKLTNKEIIDKTRKIHFLL